jgi:hypothetical protein
VSPTGKAVWVLSSHCEANLEADRRAFAALCRHLKERDVERSVIALQIENEPGILGADRDYGPEGQASFEAPVPPTLVAAMRAAGKGRVWEIWQAAGGNTEGGWGALFGASGGELMTAWSIATYIDRLAEAGKAILDVPMYINAWLGEQGFAIAGEGYPSGGPVSKVLDIYKWCTPHIDLIAPDIYVADSRGYEAMCAAYARDDNPLFVPESAPRGSSAWLMFRAVADYSAIGYAFFAVEHVFGDDGGIRPELKSLVESFRALSGIAPLLLTHQGTGRVHAVVQEEGMGSQRLELDGWLGLADFGEMLAPHGGKDWRHLSQPPADPQGADRGRGLVVQTGPGEFYLAGARYRLLLRPIELPERRMDATLSNAHLFTRQAHYLSVDEGHFDADGDYVVDRRRNGDEVDGGVWVEPDAGVVRVRMMH